MGAERARKSIARTACVALVLAALGGQAVRAQSASPDRETPLAHRIRAEDAHSLVDDRDVALAQESDIPVLDSSDGLSTLVDDRAPAQAGAEPQVPLPPIDLQGRIKDIVVAPSRLGDVVRVQTDGGGWVELTPEQYVRALHDTQLRVENGGLLYRWLNITSPLSLVWVCVGLLGQVMFTFRMVLQWWASEKHKRVIVPTAFWWGSLAGGALLFAYFCWRKDVVGVIGQSTGVFIYARNLVLIYRGKRIEAEGARPLDGGGQAVEENVAARHAT